MRQAMPGQRMQPRLRLPFCAISPNGLPSWRRLFRPVRPAAQGGNLGQITAGQTTPAFERALFALAPGAIAPEPVATRYGFHVVRLDRKREGRELPFELVQNRIAEYLHEGVQRRALAQYVAFLAAAARIDGIDLASAATHRVS